MDRITSLKDLDAFIGKAVTIVVTFKPHQMATIKLNKLWVSEGNHWDFHPGCFGGWHFELEKATGSYSRPNSMAGRLEEHLINIGAKVKVITVDATKKASR